MPITRLHRKVDENNVRKTAIENVAATKNVNLPDTKRLALGEVGNIVRNVDTGAIKKESLKSLKVVALKDVKPKVDSYWKKSEIPTASVKRETSYPAPKLVTTRSTHLAKPEVAQKVTIKVQERSKKSDGQPAAAGPAIRRQDSLLSKRQIPSLIQRLRQGPSSLRKQLSLSQIGLSAADLPSDVEDVDVNDSKKLILVSEYVKDVYAYLHELEKKFAIGQNHLASQKEITSKMRAVLLDWLNEVHYQFNLLTDTYFLAVSIIDRFLQIVSSTPRRNVQLVGVTALFIASKYEEMYPPPIKDFVYITDDAYKVEQIIFMEKFILKSLDFNLSPPLPITFARRYAKVATSGTNCYNHSLTKYLLELATIDITMAHCSPSSVSAAAVFISMKLTTKPTKSDEELWSTTFEHYTTHTLDHLRPIIRRLATLALEAPECMQECVYKKYCSERNEKVALSSAVTGSVMKELRKF